jgi:DNA mismatch repair protein MutL
MLPDDAERAVAEHATSKIRTADDLARCKGSTKFGEDLSREGMAALLHEWASCQFPNVCPHGRPIVKRVTLADLLREFGRL